MLASFLALAPALRGAPAPAGDASQALAPCDISATTSRWVAGATGYRPSHTFGRDPQWLGTLAGIAHANGRIFVFDEGRPVIVELSSTLAPVREFGRDGDGPGEISGGVFLPFLGRYGDYNFAGFDGQALAIYDRREIEVYAPDGTFRHQIRVPPSFGPWHAGVRYVRVEGTDRVVFVNDTVDFSGQRPRRLQVWEVEGSGRDQRRQLLWQMPLPWVPGKPRTETLRREARPFWAALGECQVATDGSSQFLQRYDGRTAQRDSIRLPAWQVPEFGKHEDDRFRPSFAGEQQGEPPALLRWMDLIIDPDGWAWVRAWTPQRTDEVKVFAVSLDTGASVFLELPAFPRAFGEAGVFYAVEKDPDTDEVLLVRYEGRDG